MCSSKREKKLNCGNRGINIEAIEAYIWGRIFMEEGVKDFYRHSLKINEKDGKISLLESEREQLKKSLSNYGAEKKRAVQLAIKGLLKEEDIESEMTNIESNIIDTQLKLDRINENLSFIIEARENQKNLENEIKDLKNIPYTDKQKLIRKYIERIFITFDKVYIINIKYHNFEAMETHILPIDYRIGIIMSSGKVYPMIEGVDVEKELSKLRAKLD